MVRNRGYGAHASRGGAGYDYGTQDNGLWADATDIVGFARQIHRAIMLFERDGENNDVSRHGIATARRYDVGRFRKALGDFWKVRCAMGSR